MVIYHFMVAMYLYATRPSGIDHRGPDNYQHLLPINLPPEKQMSISDMDRGSSSPSARFYANHSDSSLPRTNQPCQPAPEMHQSNPHYVEPFAHFQGFSSSPSTQRYTHAQVSAHEYHDTEGMVSPRTPIPNQAMRDSPLPRVRDVLEDSDGNVLKVNRYAPKPRGKNDMGAASAAVEPAFQCSPRSHCQGHCQISPLTSASPAPASPAYTAASAHYQTPKNYRETDPTIVGPKHQAEQLTEPRRCPFTFRVPSYSPLSSLTGLPGAADLPIFTDNLGRDDNTFTPSFLEAGHPGGKSTIYPDDSISSAGRTPASAVGTESFFSWVRRDLASNVVKIHDICLAATQRYLETLHVNWDLRHGEPVPPVGGAGPARTKSKHAGGSRWSPFDQVTPPRRRAHSDTDLHKLSCHRNNMDMDDEQSHQKQKSNTLVQQQQRKRPHNPIPVPTTSLLHNIHHICGLNWRQAQRNREDVLGAEAVACRDMKVLFDCGETIVLYHAAEFERDPDGCYEKVVEAGVGICTQLGDWEGVERLKGA